MGGFLTFLAFVFLAFVGFVIYFIFKNIQFVIQAVDLYKDMVIRLDKIIEILSAGSAASTMVASSIEKSVTGASGAPGSADTQVPEATPPSPNPQAYLKVAKQLSALGFSEEEIADRLKDRGLDFADALTLAKNVKQG